MTESPKQIPPFGLRMPPALKDRVQQAAAQNNRSMNAEIIARLEYALSAEADSLDLLERVQKLEVMHQRILDLNGYDAKLDEVERKPRIK